MISFVTANDTVLKNNVLLNDEGTFLYFIKDTVLDAKVFNVIAYMKLSTTFYPIKYCYIRSNVFSLYYIIGSTYD